jgi:methylenetetrahydrofolate dehydrogenase (NADP+)/methenyltetrahydrofolate cyclohydrolase
MTAQMLDGKALAKRLREDAQTGFAAFRSRLGWRPRWRCCASATTRPAPAMPAPSRKPARASAPTSVHVELPASAQQAEVEAALTELNASRWCTAS